MKTYSIAAAELKKIIELVNTGYQCTEFSDDETLYIRCLLYTSDAADE